MFCIYFANFEHTPLEDSSVDDTAAALEGANLNEATPEKAPEETPPAKTGKLSAAAANLAAHLNKQQGIETEPAPAPAEVAPAEEVAAPAAIPPAEEPKKEVRN